MSVPTDDYIRETLQSEVDNNGHKWRFALQVSPYVHQRMVAANLFPKHLNGYLDVHIVQGWKPDLIGSVWDDGERDWRA